MNDLIHLTISGKSFAFTRAEAEFIAEHLLTAVAKPNLGLHFTHRSTETAGEIVLARGATAYLTDC